LAACCERPLLSLKPDARALHDVPDPITATNDTNNMPIAGRFAMPAFPLLLKLSHRMVDLHFE
jgi:hypothetical protein